MSSIKANSHAALKNMVSGAAKDVAADRASSRRPSTLPQELGERLAKQIEAKGRSIQKVPIKLVGLSENIRKRYDDESIEALAESIQRDGLIQFPTVCLKKGAKGYQLVCKNGHRRILAATKLKMEQIECVIMAFDNAEAELYHTINANMREEVFYLDLAHGYQEAAALGSSDKEIAARVGVNWRTVGWYRRLAGMSPECEGLVREYPQLFNATWGVKMSRKGELLPSKKLLFCMQQMVAAGRAWVPSEDDVVPKVVETSGSAKKEEAKKQLQKLFAGRDKTRKTEFARSFLALLRDSGYLQGRSVKSIESHLWGD